MVKPNPIGPFTTGTVKSSGELRGRVLVVDVRGRVDVVWVAGANGDSGSSERKIYKRNTLF